MIKLIVMYHFHQIITNQTTCQ